MAESERLAKSKAKDLSETDQRQARPRFSHGLPLINDKRGQADGKGTPRFMRSTSHRQGHALSED